MYKLDENQRNTLLYVLNNLMVTGPDQGCLLSNAATIIRGLKPEANPEPKVKKEE